ncbi:hypothetical protein [Sporosarcina sp. FSL K6-3457]|uniref:hypothetical protein n=1 Tax=Sporosarcina sp. FSL K6-3457 TaxID=2978204 RepID=UPI0030F9A5A3
MEKVLTATSYGISLFSHKIFQDFLKTEKVRTKKVLKNFQENHERYLSSLKDGVWVPFVPIDTLKYSIKVENKGEFFDDDWVKKFDHKDFNIHIDGSIWITGLGLLLEYDKTKFIDDVISSETLDGIPLSFGFRYDLESGKYLVKITGYSLKEKLDYPNANYGFLFSFVKVDHFEGFNDPREDEKYNFNVADMD